LENRDGATALAVVTGSAGALGTHRKLAGVGGAADTVVYGSGADVTCIIGTLAIGADCCEEARAALVVGDRTAGGPVSLLATRSRSISICSFGRASKADQDRDGE